MDISGLVDRYLAGMAEKDEDDEYDELMFDEDVGEDEDGLDEYEFDDDEEELEGFEIGADDIEYMTAGNGGSVFDILDALMEDEEDEGEEFDEMLFIEDDDADEDDDYDDGFDDDIFDTDDDFR